MAAVEGDTLVVPFRSRPATVFICHASEDKRAVAQPLALALSQRKIVVWYDEFSLKWGDSLRRKIDQGIAETDFGLVVLSPSFFLKGWPQYELDGLAEREFSTGRTVILPIWHNIDHDEVARFSPSLAGRIAVKSSEGIPTIARQVRERLDEFAATSRGPKGQSTVARVPAHFATPAPLGDVGDGPVGSSIAAPSASPRDENVRKGRHRVVDVAQTIAWAPDSSRVATANLDGTVRVWDASSGLEVSRFMGHSTGLEMRGLVWPPLLVEGRDVLVSAAQDDGIRAWSPSSTQARELYGREIAVMGPIASNPSQPSLVAISLSDSLEIWRISDEGFVTVETVNPGKAGLATCLAWGPRGEFLASSSGNGVVSLWRLNRRREPRWSAVARWEQPEGPWKTPGRNPSLHAARDMVWAPDGTRLLVVLGSKSLWMLRISASARVDAAEIGNCYSASWAPDGERFATVSPGDGVVRIWDPRAVRVVHKVDLAGESPRQVAWSPDGHHIAVGGGRGLVKVVGI